MSFFSDAWLNKPVPFDGGHVTLGKLGALISGTGITLGTRVVQVAPGGIYREDDRHVMPCPNGATYMVKVGNTMLPMCTDCANRASSWRSTYAHAIGANTVAWCSQSVPAIYDVVIDE